MSQPNAAGLQGPLGDTVLKLLIALVVVTALGVGSAFTWMYFHPGF